jgi:PAS domain-containing protein
MSSPVAVAAQDIAAALGNNPIVGALLEQLPLGIAVASRDGQLTYVNPIAATLFAEHRTANEHGLRGEAGALEPLRWIVGRALLTGEVIREEEIQHLDKHDEWRTLSVSATPVEPTYVGPAQVVLTFQDVTERNRGRDWEPLVRSLSRL